MNTSLFDILLQSMKQRFPKINWKLGSLVRTLLLEPLTAIESELSEYLKSADSYNELENAIRNPELNESILDRWIDRLSITMPVSAASTGTVTIIKTTKDPITITSGTEFYWDSDTRVYASHTATYGNDLPLIELAPGVYSFEVQVQTRTQGVTFLSTGAALNWDSAPSEVQDIYVQSPIGGGMIITPKLKAELIQARLTTPGVSGLDSIRASLIQQFSENVCDVTVGDKQFYHGACTLPLYVKQSYPPTLDSILIDRDSVTIDEKNIIIKVGTEGVIDIGDVYTSSGVKVVVDSIQQHGELGNPQSYALLSISQFPDPVTVANNISFTVKVTKYSGSYTACKWLNDAQQCLPYQIVGKVPAIGELSVQINAGGSEVPADALRDICMLINTSKLNATLADSQIAAILSEYGISIHGNILYIVNIKHGKESVTSTQSGSLSTYGLLGLGSSPTALYCSINDIKCY